MTGLGNVTVRKKNGRMMHLNKGCSAYRLCGDGCPCYGPVGVCVYTLVLKRGGASTEDEVYKLRYIDQCAQSQCVTTGSELVIVRVGLL